MHFWTHFFPVPTQQTPNLAATLQAAAHSGVTVTTAGNVRLNPMMVTVDPRHPSLSVQAQYATGSEGKSQYFSMWSVHFRLRKFETWSEVSDT